MGAAIGEMLPLAVGAAVAAVLLLVMGVSLLGKGIGGLFD